MEAPAPRIRFAGWITLLSVVVYLARTSLASRAVDYIPEYDHDTKDYYLIQIASTSTIMPPVMDYPSDQMESQTPPPLQKDQQLILGRLLGLQFESRVGALSDYYLFSVARQQDPPASQRHFKRSLDLAAIGSCASSPLVARAESSFESVTERMEKRKGQEEEEEEVVVERGGDNVLIKHAKADSALPDPIVQRFYAIKRRFPKVARADSEGVDMVDNDDETRLEKREAGGAQGEREHSLSEREVMGLMGDIHKQELRQRIKKRAPLPEDTLRQSNLSPSLQQQRQQRTRQQALRKRRPLSGRGKSDGDNVQMDEDQLEDTEDTEQDSNVDSGNKKEEGSVDEDTEQEGEESEEDMENQAGEEQPEDGVASMFGIEDPGFRYQWHLHNTKDRHDINVTGVWEQGINGTGVNVAIIDDGLDMTSEDLAPNFFEEGSWDFNDRTSLPKPRLIDDQHGTRCAGEIAASKNDLCGLGVAYGAKVSGLRILSGQITDVDEAAALNYNFHENHIYSCSWGPPDDGKSMDAPKGVVLDAMINGIKNGRSGLGSIFVFATGNGGGQDDDCNFDGYTNSLYTVSIGAIDRAHEHPYYSEACSAQLAVTYSNGGGSAIYTCDVGERRCFSQHGGTSAAAPIAAGMIALMLSIRPDLTWRDVQYLLMVTAVPVAVHDRDWKRTAAGRMFNHKFGYGNLDAYALVEAAKDFKSLGTQTFFYPAIVTVDEEIPYGSEGVFSVLTVTADDLTAPSVKLGTLEHITVTVNIEHQRRGDVEVILTSPNRVESRLGAKRRYDVSTHGFVNWTFMSVKHWGESPIGDWTLTVRDQSNPAAKGRFVDWRIKFWGEVEQLSDKSGSDPSKGESLDDDHILTETETPIMHKDGAVKEGGDNTDEETSEDATESKVIVDDPESDTEKELGADQSEHGRIIEGSGGHSGDGHDNVQDGDSDVSEEDLLKDEALDTKVKAELDNQLPEDVLGSEFHQKFYVFVGVVGLGGVIVGYMMKRKLDGRGRYTSIREGILGVRRPYGRDEGDIGLLPTTRQGSGGDIREGRSQHPRGGRGPSRQSRTLYDVGEVDDEDEEEASVQSASHIESQTRPNRNVVSAAKYTDDDPGEDPDNFAVGSDTDDEDFLVTPSTRR